MKKITVLLIALFATGTVLLAQGNRRGGYRNMSPEDRAQRMTERMVKEYALNDAQKEKLYEVNRTIATPREKADADKKSQKDVNRRVDKSRSDYDAKIKEIFTKEQFATYSKRQAERREHMANRGQRQHQRRLNSNQ